MITWLHGCMVAGCKVAWLHGFSQKMTSNDMLLLLSKCQLSCKISTCACIASSPLKRTGTRSARGSTTLIQESLDTGTKGTCIVFEGMLRQDTPMAELGFRV